MKRWIWLILLTLVASPALAQDGEDAGGDFFDLGSMGNLGNVPREFDPLVEVRKLLASANVAPMDKKQERDLKKLYGKEVKSLEKPFEKRFGVPLKVAMGALQSPARGRRGANVGRPESPQVIEARRCAEQLVDKMIAALRLDQQAQLRRFQSEQNRNSKRNALIASMTRAGTPLTAEQLKEVEAILARESRLRTLLIIEAKGGEYRSQIIQLDAQTTQRLMAILDPPQRVAYAETKSAPNATGSSPSRSRGRN